MVKNLSFLFIIFLLAGCSSSKKLIVSDSLDAIPVISGSVAAPSTFAKGGTLVLGGFKPGPGAWADARTDQLSSIMLKGIQDALPKTGTNFIIQKGDQALPDYFLEGYIEDFGRDKHNSHLKLRKGQVILSVDGDIWLRETGQKIFLFKTSVVFNPKTLNSNSMAYQIGVAIAHSIGSH